MVVTSVEWFNLMDYRITKKKKIVIGKENRDEHGQRLWKSKAIVDNHSVCLTIADCCFAGREPIYPPLLLGKHRFLSLE
jgi:hypothetical protein